MSAYNDIFPKMVVPAFPHNGGIRFLMETDQIDIGEDHAAALWKIISYSNGHNSIEIIISKTQLPADFVCGVIKDLMELGIMYDSRTLYSYFHRISESPDLYPSRLSYKDIQTLQALPRVYTAGEEFSFNKDTTSHLSKLIFNRRSCREFQDTPLDRDAVGNICYHGYSITNHSVPSGGALYPLRLYAIVTKGHGTLHEGYYEYDSENDILKCYKDKIDIEQLKYCFNDISIPFNSCVQIVITADLTKETAKYSNRGYRLTLIEAGQVAQNISLYCEEQKLGSCELGGVLDQALAQELDLGHFVPLLTIAIGKPCVDSFPSLFDCIWFERFLNSQYVGINKPVNYCTVFSLGEDAAFFGATSGFAGECDVAGATSTSSHMAKAKAIMEAYERYVLEQTHIDYIGTANSIIGEWLNPEIFSTTLTESKNTSLATFAENLPIAWKAGYYLLTGIVLYVPVDLVYYGDYDATNRIHYSNSSGVAAHTDINNAIKNAILELVERDAIMRNWYEQKTPAMICSDVLPTHVQNRIIHWQKRERKVIVLDMNSSYVPTIQVIIVSKDYPCFVSGAAASFDVEEAILKALQEAEFSLYSLLKKRLTEVKPEKVKTPIDHCSLYATGQYNHSIEWLWKGNAVLEKLPSPVYSYNELLERLNPIIVDISIDERIKVVRAISLNCLPINFGYNNNSINHPIMKQLELEPTSFEMPHYFA